MLALLCEVEEERPAIAAAKVVLPCVQMLEDGTPTARVAASDALMNLALSLESRVKFMKELEYSYDVLIKAIADAPVREGRTRSNCATVLQAFCATTSGEEGLEARVAIGKGGGIEACTQLLIDGPDKARVPASGLLQYLAQVEELKSRFMTAGAVKPLLAVAERVTVDMWGRAYAVGALRWLSMSHEIMRPNLMHETPESKGKSAAVDEDIDADEPPSPITPVSLDQLSPSIRFRTLQLAPMETVQGEALEDLNRRKKELIEADCVKAMCRLLMPQRDADGNPVAKPAGKKKKAAPREPDLETAHTNATGVLRHLMLDPVGMQQVLDMNAVNNVMPLLESPSTQLRSNAHAMLSLMTLERPHVMALKRAGAPEYYTNLLDGVTPKKPSTPEVNPMAAFLIDDPEALAKVIERATMK